MKKIIYFAAVALLAGASLLAASCSDETAAEDATLSVSSTDDIAFPANATEEDEVVLTVEANTKWKATSDASWCKGYRSGEKLTVVAEPNTTPDERKAILTITAGKAAPITIAVSQGIGTLSVSESTWNPTCENETKTIEIESNTVWTAVSGAPAWCTVDKASGTGGSSLVITAAENTTAVGTARSATVTIKIGDVASKTITVTQAPSPAGIEAAKITAIAAGTDTESAFVINFTKTALTAGTTINIVRMTAGAAAASAATLDLGHVINGVDNISLNATKVIEASNVTYIGVIFTVTINGKTTVEKTLGSTAIFSAASTAAKLRAARTSLTTAGLNIPAFTPGTANYEVKTSADAAITLGAGVALASTPHNTHTTGGGVVAEISGDTAGKVMVGFSGTDPVARGTISFSNVPITCSPVKYTIPSVTVELKAIEQ